MNELVIVGFIVKNAFLWWFLFSVSLNIYQYSQPSFYEKNLRPNARIRDVMELYSIILMILFALLIFLSYLLRF